MEALALSLLILAASSTVEVGGAIGVVGAVLGIVGLLAASAAVIRASSVKANLELLRGEVFDLTASNARLDGENKQLHQEVEVLRATVTSRAPVEELVAAVQSLERSVLLAVGQR